MSNKELKNIVYNFPTKTKYGFIQSEIDDLIKDYPNINMDRFNDAMMGNTCMVLDNEIVIYHCDILKALRCGIENRDLTWEEFD